MIYVLFLHCIFLSTIFLVFYIVLISLREKIIRHMESRSLRSLDISFCQEIDHFKLESSFFTFQNTFLYTFILSIFIYLKLKFNLKSFSIGHLDSNLVIHQLNYLKIIETTTLTTKSYPHKIKFTDFI